jgi:hypothetical protein
MGLRYLTDPTEGVTVMWDSVSEWAFGPSFNDEDECIEFGVWLERNHGIDDARRLDLAELGRLHGAWCKVAFDAEGNFLGGNR